MIRSSLAQMAPHINPLSSLLPVELPARSYEEGVGRGAYTVRQEATEEVGYLLIATRSEVHLALEVAEENWGQLLELSPCPRGSYLRSNLLHINKPFCKGE